MSTNDDDSTWADFDAAPLNLFIGEPTTGHWCETCSLPSVIRFPVDDDPALPSGVHMDRCMECDPLEA